MVFPVVIVLLLMPTIMIYVKKHESPISRIMSIAIKFLKQSNPKLRLIVSFADSEQNHHVGIYQATNWIYTDSNPTHAYELNGQRFHPKSLHSKYGIGGQSIPWLRANIDPNACRIKNGVKHKYVMPLDAEMRARIAPLAKPYPKRAGSVDVDTSADQAGEGGSNPTPALQTADG